MAEVNPAAFLQNAGAVHTAEITRAAVGSLLHGNFSALTARGGVHSAIGGAFFTQQAASPNMSVDVLGGVCFIPGSESTKQGVYVCMLDATKNITIATSNPTLPRIDIIVAKIQDTFYSGASNAWSLVAVTGTAAGSPVPPAAPANSITIAQIAVAAAATSIVNANITDKRPYAAALGGVVRCTSTARPATANIPSGTLIWEYDTNMLRYLNTSNVWTQAIPYTQTQILGGTTASIAFTNIPTTMRTVRIEWTARGTNASVNSVVQMRINGSSSSVYEYSTIQMQNTTITGQVNVSGIDRFAVGIAAAASVPANNFGNGWIQFIGWDSPHSWLGATWQNHTYSDISTNASLFWGGGQYSAAGPFTSVTLFLDAGSFAAGSEFRLQAWE